MRAYFRAGGVEHALDKPLASLLACVRDHLGGATRATFERIVVLDRERAPGEHLFDRGELLALIAAAHGLLVDPPPAVRRQRRVREGALPAAEPIGALAVWLARVDTDVVYDLWRSVEAPAGD